MGVVADERAFYFNTRLAVLALIDEGVRLPAGQWSRIVNGSVSREHAERLLGTVFTEWKGKDLTFIELKSDAQVEEFERSLARAP